MQILLDYNANFTQDNIGVTSILRHSYHGELNVHTITWPKTCNFVLFAHTSTASESMQFRLTTPRLTGYTLCLFRITNVILTS